MHGFLILYPPSAPASSRAERARLTLTRSILGSALVLVALIAAAPTAAAQSPDRPGPQQNAARETSGGDTAPQSDTEVPENRGDPGQARSARFRWQSVARVTAGQSGVRELVLTMPVPADWPEQSVVVTEERVPEEMTAWNVRELKTAPRQMVGYLPQLAAGESALVSLRFDIEVHQLLAPEDPAIYRLPARIPKEMQTWLDESPGISHRDSRIRALVNELAEGCEYDWQRVERIRQWILDNIVPDAEDRPDTVVTLKQRQGTSENRVRLLVALMRASKIPARMVWADQIEYAEFWMVDGQNRGQWFPVDCSAAWPVGTAPAPAVILQKGDHFRVPEKPQESLNFVFGYASAKGTSRPRVEFAEGLVSE